MSNKQKYKLNISSFNPKIIEKDATMVLIGRRRSGKSYALRDILYNVRDIPYGTIISGTEHASPFFSDFVPSTFIFDEYKPHIPESIIERQSKLKRKAKKEGKDPSEGKFFLIFDDCLYDDKWTRDKVVRELFMNGRHYNIMYIVTMQYPLGIPPALRSNVDWVFIFQDYNSDNREKIYKSFGGALGSKEAFDTVMDSLGDHECLVIHNSNKSRRIEDRVFWFKAKERVNFKMGCEAYWRAHFKNKKNEEEEADESSDDNYGDSGITFNGRDTISNYKPKKKKLDIKINKYY